MEISKTECKNTMFIMFLEIKPKCKKFLQSVGSHKIWFWRFEKDITGNDINEKYNTW